MNNVQECCYIMSIECEKFFLNSVSLSFILHPRLTLAPLHHLCSHLGHHDCIPVGSTCCSICERHRQNMETQHNKFLSCTGHPARSLQAFHWELLHRWEPSHTQYYIHMCTLQLCEVHTNRKHSQTVTLMRTFVLKWMRCLETHLSLLSHPSLHVLHVWSALHLMFTPSQ